MSGQWQPQENKPDWTPFEPHPRIPGICKAFGDIMEEASNRVNLLEAVSKLSPDEVKIAAVYVNSLLRTRPVKKEDRSYMATLELETIPDATGHSND